MSNGPGSEGDRQIARERAAERYRLREQEEFEAEHRRKEEEKVRRSEKNAAREAQVSTATPAKVPRSHSQAKFQHYQAGVKGTWAFGRYIKKSEGAASVGATPSTGRRTARRTPASRPSAAGVRPRTAGPREQLSDRPSFGRTVPSFWEGGDPGTIYYNPHYRAHSGVEDKKTARLPNQYRAKTSHFTQDRPGSSNGSSSLDAAVMQMLADLRLVIKYHRVFDRHNITFDKLKSMSAEAVWAVIPSARDRVMIANYIRNNQAATTSAGGEESNVGEEESKQLDFAETAAEGDVAAVAASGAEGNAEPTADKDAPAAASEEPKEPEEQKEEAPAEPVACRADSLGRQCGFNILTGVCNFCGRRNPDVSKNPLQPSTSIKQLGRLDSNRSMSRKISKWNLNKSTSGLEATQLELREADLSREQDGTQAIQGSFGYQGSWQHGYKGQIGAPQRNSKRSLKLKAEIEKKYRGERAWKNSPTHRSLSNNDISYSLRGQSRRYLREKPRNPRQTDSDYDRTSRFNYKASLRDHDYSRNHRDSFDSLGNREYYFEAHDPTERLVHETQNPMLDASNIDSYMLDVNEQDAYADGSRFANSDWSDGKILWTKGGLLDSHPVGPEYNTLGVKLASSTALIMSRSLTKQGPTQGQTMGGNVKPLTAIYPPEPGGFASSHSLIRDQGEIEYLP